MGRWLSLDEIAAKLEQSKSNVSIQIRVLVEWRLVRLRRIPGSRRDHYEAATDFFRAFQEIFERRFRLDRAPGARRGGGDRARRPRRRRHARRPRLRARALAALGNFFGLADAGIGAFLRGEPFPAQKLAEVVPLPRR